MARKLSSVNWLAMGIISAALVVPAQAQDSKYVSLFDGKTMSGWEFLPLKQGAKTNWEVKDGALVGTGEASMLFSPTGDYKNCKFKAEIKINEKGNSGMYFRTEKKPSFTEGYEAQINSTHGDPIKTGSIYTMVHVYEILVPAGEWFTQEVEVVDKDYRGKLVTAIKVSVNGKVLYEYLDYNRTHQGGYFAFQQHDPGSIVAIRKVEVQKLPDTPVKK